MLYRPIVFMPPDRKVFPPSWLEHVPFAFWLTDVLRPAVFVELGTQSGNSYSAFAQAVQHLGLATACYAVDTWQGDAQAGRYAEDVFEEWRQYHDARFAAFSRLVRSTFDDAASQFADGSIDLLHIDGCHTFEAVTHDLATWGSKLSRRGVVLLHDINVREADFGAWRAWEEAKRRSPSFEFLHGHGLGVLAVGSDLPADLIWLCTIAGRAPREAAAVRQFFARLGRVVLGEHEAAGALERQKARCEPLETSLDEHTRALEASREEHARTIEALELARAEHARAREELARLRTEGEAEVRRLEGELGELENAVKRATADLEPARAARLVQDSEIATLWQRLAAVERERSMVVRALRTAQRRLSAGRAGRRDAGSAVGKSRPAAVLETLEALGVAPRQLATSARRAGTASRLLLRPSLLRAAHVIAHSGLFDADFYHERNLQGAGTSLTPLAHYVLIGARENRGFHPLFETRWYLERNPDVTSSGANPLAHYVRIGSREGRDPHPLFSHGHYLGLYPDLRDQSACLLRHYVEHGALEGRSTHPLFDPDYYMDNCPEAVASNADPLRHFLEHGWRGGRNPHPLFDTQAYLARYADVRASGANPLVHYVVAGGREGRQPHPLFDGRFYLDRYADVAGSGLDPLSHYLVAGAAEGRDPSPDFSTLDYVAKHPDVVEAGLNPLVHYALFGRREGRGGPRAGSEAQAPSPATGEAGRMTATPLLQQRVRLRAAPLHPAASERRVVVCLTHVMPVKPRAGNEYRIHRMLRWLHASGYSVVPIVAPIDGFRPSDAQLDEVVEEFANVVFCLPDGRIQYALRDLPDVVRSLDGEYTLSAAALLGETASTPRQRELLQIDRTFCTDALIATVLRLQQALGPYVLLAEYIWMSRVLPLASRYALKVIDTHDVLSTRRDKVDRFGIDDWTIEPEAERLRLQRADVVLAIQENERRALQAMAPSVTIVTTGVDFNVRSDAGEPVGRRILLVASDNPMNRRGLADFLRFAWPAIAGAIPDAELIVAGAVSDSVVLPPPRVQVLGTVADLEPLYRACRMVINPAVAGTGLKIKTLEALAHLRPIVTWPNGVDGLSAELTALCVIAQDWYEFAQRAIEVLQSDREPWFSPADRAVLAEQGAAERVYTELGRVLEHFFEPHG